MSNGYLVVLKQPPDVLRSYNPRYRGLYRTRPFHISEYEGGFDDPYFSGKWTDAHGLIPDMTLARQVLSRYAEVEPPSAFETIYVQTEDGGPVLNPESSRVLGWDVACDTPFWSIVVDSPSPSDSRFREFLSRLNEYGLFQSAEEAFRYLAAYRLHFPEKQDVVLRIWRIHLLEQPLPGEL